MNASCQVHLFGSKPTLVPAQGKFSTSKQVCQFFIKGTCKFGAKCRNLHQTPELTHVKPAAPSWHMLPHDKDVKFVHANAMQLYLISRTSFTCFLPMFKILDKCLAFRNDKCSMQHRCACRYLRILTVLHQCIPISLGQRPSLRVCAAKCLHLVAMGMGNWEPIRLLIPVCPHK